MINGADAALTRRVAQKQQAHTMAKGWTDAMKEADLASIVVGFDAPLNDETALLQGRIVAELRALGYRLIGYSHSIIGEAQATIGGKLVPIKVANISYVIESIDGNARRIIE